jgi:ribonuclease HI
VVYIDGGARGNPGPGGYGVRVERPDGTVLAEFHRPLGVTTNNAAEYEGLLAALRYLLDRGVRRAQIRSDSELLVRQMTGLYRVRHPRLQPLHAEAQALAARFERLRFEHVPRAANAAADRLANLAMDEAERGQAGPSGRRTSNQRAD